MPLSYLAAVSVTLAVVDAREQRLPNTLVMPGLVLLGWAIVGAEVQEPGRALSVLAACACAAAVFGAGWLAGAVGMGDVKLAVLLAGTAALLGAVVLPLAGVALALLMAPALVSACSDTRIPLGPPLLAAFWWATVLAWPP
ncbi:prepilin peptidase [Herbiconiux sp. CPCC 203407]|uniref:Prepilin peptidase n=1 Tax=Herbiconiux oxytropis TaxID=2970915 RepID=A0AA42BUL3_9MICO|nr:prepilin peptidase [Herbiconiux oxytropis]MCS5723864.1 prepilin peptidase [Herbiconiux oxytropis]MCS5727670.1 prepilin peptidase [Herbiconiux oxytropis]